MQWGFLLLAFTGCFATGISYYLHSTTGSLKFLGFFLASLLFILVNIAIILTPVLTANISSFILSQIIQWGQIYCIALVLSALLLFVRESKPEFSRFPIIYVAFPVLIILSYLLVYNTIILKNWLINIYYAGAVAVSLLMYGIYSYREPVYKTTFVGSFLFFITFLLYLLLPPSVSIIWQVSLSISIVTLFSGYWFIEQQFNQFIKSQ